MANISKIDFGDGVERDIKDTTAREMSTTHTATSENLALAPSAEGNALPLTVCGMSVQSGTPTPSSPVAIESAKADYKSEGKNLLPYPYASIVNETYLGVTIKVDNDGVVTLNGQSEGSFSSRRFCSNLDCKHLRGKECTFTGCPSGGSSTTYRIGIGVVSEQTSAFTVFDTGSGFTFTFPEDALNITIYLSVGGVYNFNNLKFYPMLRLASVTDSTYEPYHSSTVTTDLTLRAIEVASTDDYNLVRDGKYYMADTVDWSEDDGYVLTRRIKHNEWDENEDWERYSTTGRDTYYVTKNDAKPNTKAYCNLFNMMASVTSVIGEGFIHTNHGINFNYSGQNESTLSDWLTFVTTNHIIIDYILATPTTEALTAEQASALLSMRTYDEATLITPTGDVAPTTTVEYATERVPALALSGNNAKGEMDAFKCDQTTAGTYYLQATVNASGAVSYSWVSTT